MARYKNSYHQKSYLRGLCVDCVRRTSALFCFSCGAYTPEPIEGEDRKCPACGGELNWVWRCASCAAANRDYLRQRDQQRYEQHRKVGRCPYCPRPIKPGLKTCGNHL